MLLRLNIAGTGHGARAQTQRPREQLERRDAEVQLQWREECQCACGAEQDHYELQTGHATANIDSTPADTAFSSPAAFGLTHGEATDYQTGEYCRANPDDWRPARWDFSSDALEEVFTKIRGDDEHSISAHRIEVYGRSRGH